MEQIYMLELFIDSVTIKPSEDDTSGSDKKLIVKINFGPKAKFIIKEKELVPDDSTPKDEQEGNSWTRVIRVGKSYIFPSYPDTVLVELSKGPLELEVWTDDEKEEPIFVGVGTMEWSTEFFHRLKETLDPKAIVEPLVLRQVTPLKAECCCRFCGEIAFILRLSCLGDSVLTEFQELESEKDNNKNKNKDKDKEKENNKFVFRTNRAPTVIECKRMVKDKDKKDQKDKKDKQENENKNKNKEDTEDEEDINFCMIGSLYETITLDAPEEVVPQPLIVCTDKNICEVEDAACHTGQLEGQGDKIKMGSIAGPCGSPNCPLVQKIKTYIRQTPLYKKASEKQQKNDKEPAEKTSKVPVCGMCVCPDDTWHRSTCPESNDKDKKQEGVCENCLGYTGDKKICEDKEKKERKCPEDSNKENSKEIKTDQKETKSKHNKTTVVQCLTHNFKLSSLDDHQYDKATANIQRKHDIFTETGQNISTADFNFYSGEIENKQDSKICEHCGEICDFDYDDATIVETLGELICNQVEKETNEDHEDALLLGSPEDLVWEDISKRYNPSGNQNVTHIYNVTEVPSFKDAVYSNNISGSQINSKSQNVDFSYYVNLLKHKMDENTVQVYNCTIAPDNKDCKCALLKPEPPCNTFDCNCITNISNKASRKKHKPYCPLYKHKPQCPVIQTQDSDLEDVEEEPIEPLPYGLPPIKLGPCPVLGRPCTAPDGFTRMYKTAAVKNLPPSYSDAGKVCCSKEFERIKNALKECMKYEKLNECDISCVDAFLNNVDARCCDRDQVLAQLEGKSCCGPHKLASQDKAKETKK